MMKHSEKEVTLVVRQSRWSPSPESVLGDAQRDSKIVNLNLLGLSLTTSVLNALVQTLTTRTWNQVHIHQCHTMDLDCRELGQALTTQVRSLVLSGSSDLLNAVLDNPSPTTTTTTTTTTETTSTTTLQKLTINQPRTGLKETQCLQLGKFLAGTPHLQALSLKGTGLQAPGLLAPGLSTAKRLRTLILSDTGLGEQGRADLVVCCLKNNNDGKRQFGIGAVQRLLLSPSSSLSLSLSTSLTNSNNYLVALDLSNLHLQDGHAAKLFQALAGSSSNNDNNNSNSSSSSSSSSRLEQLNLSFNDITCDGIVAISRYIPRLQHLSKVSLKPNPWGSRGATALVAALRQNTSIEYLDSLLLIRQAPLLRYYTALNRGGRRIILSSSAQKTKTTKTTKTTQVVVVKVVPLGLWPLILERAWKISYEPASYFDDDPKAKFHAVYYLLRNGNFINATR
jgi:hypothetical protein